MNNNDNFYKIDLFSRITHFGYENEYPFCDSNYDYQYDSGDDYDDGFYDELNFILGKRYSCHSECGGMEMVSPTFDTFDDLLNGIDHVYNAIDHMVSTPISNDREITMRTLLTYRHSIDGYEDYWNARDAYEDSERGMYEFTREDDEDLARDYDIVIDDYDDFVNSDRFYDFIDAWNESFEDLDDPRHYRFYDSFPYDVSDFIDDDCDIRILDDYGFFEYRRDVDEDLEDTEETYYVTNTDMLNGNDVGVHIRIDVSKWTTQEIFRFVRLFSDEWSGDYLSDWHQEHPDYIQWMEHHFGRNWYNYNKPVPYKKWHSTFKNAISNGYLRPMSFKNKRHNISLEDGDFGDGVITIEIRAFGVNDDVYDAKRQATFIPLLCAIVEHSIKHGDRNKSVIDQLHDSWIALIANNGIDKLLNNDKGDE